MQEQSWLHIVCGVQQSAFSSQLQVWLVLVVLQVCVAGIITSP
jgi:hypothetical protein